MTCVFAFVAFVTSSFKDAVSLVSLIASFSQLIREKSGVTALELNAALTKKKGVTVFIFECRMEVVASKKCSFDIKILAYFTDPV